GEVVEEHADVRVDEHHGEQQEQEDEGGGDLDRGPEDPGAGGEEGADGEVLPGLTDDDGGVPDRQKPDDHDGQSDAAPGRLEREHDAERRDHVVECLEAHDLYEVAGQVRVPHHDVQVDRESHQGQHRVPPGDPGLPA